jgi:hypothetical protein
VSGDGKQEVKEKGKNKQTDKYEKTKQGIKQKSFKGINRECWSTN